MFSRIYSGLILLLIASVAACKSSVVNDAPATGNSAPGNSHAAAQSVAAPTPAAVMTQAAPASTSAAASTSGAPSPTTPPLLKKAMEHPGVPVSAPESLRRPATKEEMEMMMKQLPPEVRQRLMGLQAGQAPGAKPPTPAPKKN